LGKINQLANLFKPQQSQSAQQTKGTSQAQVTQAANPFAAAGSPNMNFGASTPKSQGTGLSFMPLGALGNNARYDSTGGRQGMNLNVSV